MNYEYSIGRFEWTTSEAVDFFNAAFDRPVSDRLPHLIPPSYWGAAGATPTVPGGQRWRVPAGNELRPVGNISWRMAAMYCNWLHNGKSLDREAFLDGAYDVNTFYYLPVGAADQRTHHPGARYWIPTWDEWLKASHYDPDKDGPGQGGWWLFSNGSDTPLVYGPPGALVDGRLTEANAGWNQLHFPASPFLIPLGAYPDTQTPWGLLDAAGATTEWTEEVSGVAGLLEWRGNEGSFWDSSLGSSRARDWVGGRGGDFPSLSSSDMGFRIASSVPTPSSSLIVVGGWVLVKSTRRRRKE